jgi:hypothetical protein
MKKVQKFDFDLEKTPNTHKHTMDSPTAMTYSAHTPDQFFDELDELFGSQDGYTNHLERIKGIVQEVEDLKEELAVSGGAIDTEAMEELFDIFDGEVASCDIPDAVREFMKENEKLKREQRECCCCCASLCDGHTMEIDELKEELRLLKEEFEEYKAEVEKDIPRASFGEILAQIHPLLRD